MGRGSPCSPSARRAGLAGFPARHCAGQFGNVPIVIATSLQKGSAIVSHYTVEELIARWKREELTTEQLLGQLLLVLREHEQRLKELARQVPAMPEPPR